MAINNHLVVVSISIMVAILYNDVPIPMFVTITYDRAIAISVAVSITSCTDGHASQPDKQTEDRIWLVSFVDYDLGYFDDETCRLEPLANPFGPKVLPTSSV